MFARHGAVGESPADKDKNAMRISGVTLFNVLVSFVFYIGTSYLI